MVEKRTKRGSFFIFYKSWTIFSETGKGSSSLSCIAIKIFKTNKKKYLKTYPKLTSILLKFDVCKQIKEHETRFISSP